MNPLTPLGKPLTQQPVAGANTPVTPAITPQPEEPVTAFQWFSLARASWNWIFRPLWYICVKWPTLLMFGSGSSAGSHDEEMPAWRKRHKRQMDEENW